jgi:lipoprotein-releasing system permease protein
VLRVPFELGLALRYLRPRWNFVSVITLLCVLGVTLGVAVLIVVIAVMTGADLELRQKMVGFNSHLRLGVPGHPMGDWETVMRRIESRPGIKGVAPFVLGRVLMQTQPDPAVSGAQSDAPFVRGIDPELESRVSVLTRTIVEGKFDLRGNGVLVGSSLADRLRIRVGDRVALHSTHALESMLKTRNQKQQEIIPAENFEVRGIFQVGYDQIDSQFIVVSLANAQDLFAQRDGVSGLSIMLDSSEPGNTLRQQIALERDLGTPFRTVSWMEESRELLAAIEMEKDAMLLILFFVMIVAAFCIVCSQIAFVIRKTREIGILKGVGATTGQIVLVFLAQSFALGFMGVAVGLATGIGMVAIRNDFLKFIRTISDRPVFPASVYSFVELPAVVLPQDLYLICGVSLLMCLLAGVVPAWIAARMHPVEALRNE